MVCLLDYCVVRAVGDPKGWSTLAATMEGKADDASHASLSKAVEAWITAENSEKALQVCQL